MHIAAHDASLSPTSSLPSWWSPAPRWAAWDWSAARCTRHHSANGAEDSSWTSFFSERQPWPCQWEAASWNRTATHMNSDTNQPVAGMPLSVLYNKFNCTEQNCNSAFCLKVPEPLKQALILKHLKVNTQCFTVNVTPGVPPDHSLKSTSSAT